MLVRNSPYRARKPKYISEFLKKNTAALASDGSSRHSPSLHLGLTALQPSRRHHTQSLLGPLISWPKTDSCFGIPPRASRASLPPQRWATTCCRLSLCHYTAPLSCRLQALASSSHTVSRLSHKAWTIRWSLSQFVSILSLLLNHGNPIFELVCVFLPFPPLPFHFWWKSTSALSLAILVCSM